MKSHPTIALRFLSFIVFAFLIVLSCTKDNDEFESTVLGKSEPSVEEPAKKKTEENITAEEIFEEDIEADAEDILTAVTYETRTTIFPVINDAYVQGNTGYDQHLLRLEDGRRTSYLMFDLSLIDSIGGTVNTSNLEFTIETDDGNGSISVFKSISKDWSEEKLSAKNAPQTETLAGKLSTKFDVGQTHEIALDTAMVHAEILTLVLIHEEGNDLAFASKEHPNGNGPALVVNYLAPQDAEAIVFEDKTEILVQAETTEEDTADENIIDEKTTQEEETKEPTKEETTEEEAPDEDTTKEADEKEATAEDIAVEVATEETEEETQNEASVEEKAMDKVTEEEAADEETTVETEEKYSTENEEAEEETNEDEEAAESEEKEATEEETIEEIEEETPEDTEEKTQNGDTIDEEPSDDETNNEADAPINESPIAVAEANPSSGNAPLKVTFKGNNSIDDLGVKTYKWDFRDGSTSTEANPTHTFEKTGTLAVRLTVTDDQGESNTDTVTISISEKKENEAPVAAAKASTTSGEAPLKVQFNAGNSSDDDEIDSYRWNFGDGNTTGSKNPSHTFEEPGTFEVELSVTDQDGLSDSNVVTITVEKTENESPKAVASANPTSGEVTLEVQFKGSSSSDDSEIKTYFWDFKDGSTSTNSNPSHSFTKAGAYDVGLSVTDDEGLIDTETVTIEVNETENVAPEAVASGSPLTGDAPLDVQFKGSGSKDDNEVTGYFWDFADGSTTTSKNPSHTFSEPGEYEVELSVKDAEGLTDATTIKVTVNQRPADTGGGDDDTGGNGSDGGSSGGGDDIGGSSDNEGNSGNYPSNAVFASSFGYNSSDATDALVKALKSGKSYVVVDKQSKDWIVRPISLIDLKDMTIVFEPGVVLRAKKGAFRNTNDQLFQIRRSRNITIEGYGATFRMNKDEYSGGEHRHALDISKCNGVTVRGLTIQDSGGDGVYIGGMEAGSYSENITIEDVVSKNNRRLGMGIISAQNVWVRNSEFLSSKGTLPEAGVALEPNSSSERLVNINFSNCKFAENDHMGFFLSTGKMNSSSRPISVKVSDSEFSYNAKSPNDNRPRAGISLSHGNTTNPVKGEIIFEDILFNGGDHRIIFGKTSAESFRAIFKDCKARNVSRKGDAPVIDLEALGSASTLGGYVFENFSMEYSSDVAFMRIRASSKYTVKDIKGDFRIKEPNDNPLTYYGSYDKSKNRNVSISFKHID